LVSGIKEGSETEGDENRVMRRIFEPKELEVEESCIIRTFMTYNLRQV
jgi:hypothetical protein